jgi:N-acetyl-anhydromuramyl-L-alanine amidase AmpD
MYADFGIEKTVGIRAVDTIVVHSAYSLEGDPYDPKNLYAVFKKYNVSPHYMIDRNGTIYKMADENDLAHHAGKSHMKDGRDGVNAFSIGVELINSTTDYPTRAQYLSLAKLIIDVKTRYNIKYIVGHSDIAPERKSDPWNFDFGILSAMMATDKHAKGETK